MYYWVLSSSFMLGGAYNVCAPILPIELEKKGIVGSITGLIFALFSVGSILWAPVVGKYLIKSVGPRNLLGISVAVMGVTFVCFGLVEMVEDRMTVIVLSSIIRVV